MDGLDYQVDIKFSYTARVITMTILYLKISSILNITNGSQNPSDPRRPSTESYVPTTYFSRPTKCWFDEKRCHPWWARRRQKE